MKRSIISVMSMAAALMIAASCSEVDLDIASEGSCRTVITAVAEAVGGGTRAHNQYSYDVLWDKGDRIYVSGGEKSNTFTVSDESAGTNKGMFTEDIPSYGITGGIEAFYPANLKTDDGYVWPAVQVNNQVPPMYAHQTISGTDAQSYSSGLCVFRLVHGGELSARKCLVLRFRQGVPGFDSICKMGAGPNLQPV